MNDEPHVSLIDSHTKGNRRYDDVDLIPHPLELYVFPCGIRHPSMVEITAHLVLAKLGAQDLTLVPRQAVDNAALVQEFLFNEHNDVFGKLFHLRFVSDTVDQIGSVKTALEVDHVPKFQDLNDVVLNGNGRCGCQDCQWHIWIP